MLLLYAIGYLLLKGVGIWGINIPVAWGFAIVNFVWWIGIGHAGTLISAILLLLHQKWRTSINRFAEAMTMFAVACAGLFPLLHLGRPWFFYWLLPYPNTMELWPQFRSPLVWDVFAVSTYFTVSLLFWYIGMIPDLATLRDRSTESIRPDRLRHLGDGLAQLGPALAALRDGLPAPRRPGDAAGRVGAFGRQLRFRRRHPARLARDHLPALLRRRGHLFRLRHGAGAGHSAAGLLRLAGLHHAAPPGEHGQGHAGDRLDGRLRLRHRGVHGLVQRQHLREIHARSTACSDPTPVYYWALITCNVAIPQVLWFKRVRSNPPLLFVVALVVLVGMWLERYVIVVTSLHRDYLPSSWGMYSPTVWDWSHVPRHDRAVLRLDVPVHPLPADDLDLGDADVAAGVARAARRPRRGGTGGALMATYPGLYGLVAEFEKPTALVAAVHSARQTGYTRMDAYSPFPIEELAEALGFRRTQAAAADLARGHHRRRCPVRLAVLLCRHQLPGEHGRPAAEQLAGIYPGDVRVDDPLRVADRRLRSAGPVRSADAVSSAVSRAALRQGHARRLLSVHRGGRSALRSRGDEPVPGRT